MCIPSCSTESSRSDNKGVSLSGGPRRVHILALCVFASAAFGALSGTHAEEPIYTARVFLDRTFPGRSVSVVDFRINATPSDRGDSQFVTLYSAEGTFHVPFEAISEIDINRPLGSSADVARYDATVKLKQGGGSRRGRLDVRVLRGNVDSIPWHVLLAAQDDRGANLYRIVFVE